MDRDGRYGALLILVAVFLLISVFHFSGNPFRPEHAGTPPTDGPFAAFSAGSAPLAPGPPSKPLSAPPRSPSAALDLNSATKQDLLSLPGIGKVTAERILRRRAELGRFSSVEELTEVERLGKVKVDRIRGLVTVRNGLPATKNP